MSYILDALKRADAERARGSVPGLHTQPLANPPRSERTLASQMLWWLFSAAVVITISALALWRWPSPEHEPQASLPPQLPSPPAARAPVPTPAEAPPAFTAAAVTPPAVEPPAFTAPDVPPPAVTTPAAVPPLPKRTPARAPASPAALPVFPPAPPNLARATPDVPRAKPVPLVNELPEVLRRQIPPLTITGSVYSIDPRQRLLLVNNLVLPQDSQVAAGVTLIEIESHSAVFSFQQTRFRVRY